MKVTVQKLDKDLHMEAANEQGGLIRMDGNTEIGGLEGGFSPMQLLLAGIGGCSAIDIIGILEKQKQNCCKDHYQGWDHPFNEIF